LAEKLALDVYNLLNSSAVLAYNPAFVPGGSCAGHPLDAAVLQDHHKKSICDPHTRSSVARVHPVAGLRPRHPRGVDAVCMGVGGPLRSSTAWRCLTGPPETVAALDLVSRRDGVRADQVVAVDDNRRCWAYHGGVDAICTVLGRHTTDSALKVVLSLQPDVVVLTFPCRG
jgi:hypothetical protein